MEELLKLIYAKDELLKPSYRIEKLFIAKRIYGKEEELFYIEGIFNI